MKRTSAYILALILTIPVALSGCSTVAGGAVKMLTGGGPNVAANVQAGKTNSQTVGTTRVTEQKLVRPQARTIQQSSDENRVRAEQVQTVVVNEVPAWIIIVALVGWLLPSPGEIARWLRKPFQKRKRGS